MANSPGSEDNQMNMMTSSYHEIIDKEKRRQAEVDEGQGSVSMTSVVHDLSEMNLPKARKLFDKARNWVGDLSTEGTVSQEGQQISYVVEDINKAIRLSSPATSPIKEIGLIERPLEETENQSQPNDINLIINEIESEAKRLASSVDNLTENLSGILHSISSLSVDCSFVSCDGVTQLCDTADASIKVMYQVMAKCEELNKAVRPIYRVHQEIKNTKRLLDKVEAEVNA